MKARDWFFAALVAFNFVAWLLTRNIESALGFWALMILWKLEDIA